MKSVVTLEQVSETPVASAMRRPPLKDLWE